MGILKKQQFVLFSPAIQERRFISCQNLEGRTVSPSICWKIGVGARSKIGIELLGEVFRDPSGGLRDFSPSFNAGV